MESDIHSGTKMFIDPSKSGRYPSIPVGNADASFHESRVADEPQKIIACESHKSLAIHETVV